MPSIRENATARSGATWTVRYRRAGKNGGRTFTTHKAAKDWLREIEAIGLEDALARLDGPAPAPDMPTVGEWHDRYIAGRTGVTEGTRSDYASYVRQDLGPAFGKIRLDALKRDHIARWINEQAVEGRASKTIKHRHSLLSAALTQARRDELIVRNVAEGIRIPRDDHTRREMEILTEPELAFLAGFIDPYWRPLVAFLAGTGARWGEGTALTVGNVVLVGREPHVRIRQAWKHTNTGKMELGPPKSRKSLRDIPLGLGVQRLVADMIRGRDGDEYVFVNKQGNPVRQGTFYEQIWQPAVASANGELPARKARWGSPPPAAAGERLGKHPRIHDLRHTHASLLLAQGASMWDVQMRLGHESIQTTESTYSHLVPGWMSRVASIVDVAFPVERKSIEA